MGGLFQSLTTLSLTVTGGKGSPPERPFPVELVPDLVTVVSDVLTALAIIVGGLFAYYKFLKGRGAGAPAGLELTASFVGHCDHPKFVPHRCSAGALVVEVGIRNNGILTVTVPRDSEQLVSVSSISEGELVRAGPGLSQGPLSWKRPDAYFASANVLLDNGQQPSADIKLRQGQVLPLAAVFPVPGKHHPVAFLVVFNCSSTSGFWVRRTQTWTEMRRLVVPEHEPRPGKGGA